MIQIFLAIIFIPFSSLFFYTETKRGKYKFANIRFAIFLFMLLFLISGLRHIDIANDSRTYYESFKDLDISNSFWDIESRFEPGYEYLAKFLKIYISDQTPVLFIVTSFLIQLMCIFFIYRNSKKIWLSVFFFITWRYYFFTVSAIRQGLALGVCLIAYEYLKKDKIKEFIICVIFASTFHYSALIFLLLPLFKKLKFTIKKMFFIGILTILIFTALSPILNIIIPSISYGGDYLEQGVSEDFSSRIGPFLIATFTFIMLIFALFFKYNKVADHDVLARYELWTVFFSIILGVLAIKFGILIRFTYYFAIFSIILVPNILVFIKNTVIGKLLLPFWVLISIIYFMMILYYRPEWYNFYPYKFFWQ